MKEKLKDFKELIVRQKVYSLTLQLYKITAGFPKDKVGATLYSLQQKLNTEPRTLFPESIEQIYFGLCLNNKLLGVSR
jgi:hypothetical protein